MQVELNYGRGKLPVQLPDDFQVTVLRKLPMPPVAISRVTRCMKNNWRSCVC